MDKMYDGCWMLRDVGWTIDDDAGYADDMLLISEMKTDMGTEMAVYLHDDDADGGYGLLLI